MSSQSKIIIKIKHNRRCMKNLQLTKVDTIVASSEISPFNVVSRGFNVKQYERKQNHKPVRILTLRQKKILFSHSKYSKYSLIRDVLPRPDVLLYLYFFADSLIFCTNFNKAHSLRRSVQANKFITKCAAAFANQL